MLEMMMKSVVAYPGYKSETQKKRENIKKSVKTTAVKKPCPFTQDPYDNCFCAKMLSQNIEAAIHYCGSNFEQCEIYKKWA